MTWERVFIRAQAAILLGLLLTGMVWGPKALVAAVFGAGAPLPGEVVPRQIPYRGYLEQNGVAVNDPGMPMRFRLFGIDGGVLHEESRAAVPVQDGQFSVELGDSTAIPVSVTQQNFLELEVAVGSTPSVLAGRQRLLSVPYAARALDSWRAESATGTLATQLVPPGVVAPFVGTMVPAGWLPCDGAAVSRSTYAALFAVIGTSSGVGDGVTTFNVPDYRGRFLRGADEGTGRDPDSATRSSENGGTSVSSIGSIQGDGFAAHSHGVSTYVGSATGGAALSFNANRADWLLGTGAVRQFLGFASETGGGETRPKNVAVRFIIKF